MGFICSAGAATIKLQSKMKRGNISACAGASLSSRGNPRRRFLLHPGRAGPHLSPVPVGMAPLFSLHRGGFVLADLGSERGFHSRQPDWRSRRMKLSLKHLRRIILSGLVWQWGFVLCFCCKSPSGKGSKALCWSH